MWSSKRPWDPSTNESRDLVTGARYPADVYARPWPKGQIEVSRVSCRLTDDRAATIAHRASTVRESLPPRGNRFRRRRVCAYSLSEKQRATVFDGHPSMCELRPGQ
jgi:hypothetical protein